MPILLRLAIFLLIVAAYVPSSSAQSKANAYKEKTTRLVYERILKSIGVSKSAAPILVFSFNAAGDCEEPCRHSCRSCNAIYSATKKSIYFGEAIYDIAADMGADSTAALAFALGHEIAHFYLKHEWGLPFGMYEGSDYANLAFSKQLEDPDQIAKMEAQADFLGMLYAYLAGYSSPNVGLRFFRKFQTRTGWEDKFSEKYPSFSDRCRLTQDAENALQKFIPVFEVANLLLISEEYRTAEQCYRRISKDFASREMLNNTGVAGAMYTLTLMDSLKRKYAYPYLYDSETRLSSTQKNRNPQNDKQNFGLENKDVAMEFDDINHNRNPRNDANGLTVKKEEKPNGVTDPNKAHNPVLPDSTHHAGEDPTEKIDTISIRLQYSLECFEDALKADPEYSTAQVNIALTYCLLGNMPAATEAAAKALRLAESSKNPTVEANAKVAAGIAQAFSGDKEAAKKSFSAARSHNRQYADLNLAVINGVTKTANTRNSKSLAVDLTQEMINDYGVKQVHELFSKDALRAARRAKVIEEGEIVYFRIEQTEEPFSEPINIYHLPTVQFGAICVEWFPSSDQTRVGRIAYLTTPMHYMGKSARGIRLGNSSNDLERAYGAPYMTTSTTQGQSYLYNDSNKLPALIFNLDHDGKVRNWTIVCHKTAGEF